MIRTKIRSTVIALAAVATVASSAGFLTQNAQAAKKSTASSHDILCEVLRLDSDNNSNLAAAVYQAGNKAAGARYSAMADQSYNAAVAEGCGWAIWRKSGTSTIQAVPVGAAQMTP